MVAGEREAKSAELADRDSEREGEGPADKEAQRVGERVRGVGGAKGSVPK